MRKILFLLACLLLPAALLINLGLMVFIDDEAIRSLVALEMQWSGNYVAPTMHGDAYLNKPPAWNWVLALSFWCHGGPSEWAARLPTVFALLGFAATTWHFSRRHFPDWLAGLHAFTVITCGRMLFWDSMLALIDVTFSWVIFTQIMLLYEYGRRGKWWQAFGWGYALTAVAFMLKGLPAIVFQGITVLTLLGWLRAWRQFFRAPHLLSGIGCVALLSLYYWQYSQHVDLVQVAERLFIESGKRTAIAHSLWESVQHIVAFPLEMSYHFLPWTLLLGYLLQRGSWKRLKTNDFAAFCLLVFLTNIPVYWLSPNVYPRYLLMLFPLLFASLLYLHQQHREENSRTARTFRWLWLGLMTLVAVLTPFIPLVPETAIVNHAWLKSILLGAAAGAVVWTMWRSSTDILLGLTVILLLMRVTFNFFILPPRAAGDEHGIAVRDTARKVTARYANDSLAIYGYTLIEPATGYYLTTGRGRVVPRQWANFDTSTAYILAQDQYPTVPIVATDSLYLRHKRMHYATGTLPQPSSQPTSPPAELRDGMGSGL